MQRSWALLGLALLAWAGLGPWARGQATLVADTHVNAALPAVNSGGISNVNVGGGYTGLFEFDLSLLPPGTTPAQVSRAVLLLYANRVDTAGSVSLQPLGGVWSELGVTYQTLPALGPAVQSFVVTQAGAFIAVDVTVLVQGWVANPASNFGFALTATSGVMEFDSKENDLTAHAAQLTLTLVSQGPVGPAGPPGAIGAQGLPGVAGPSGATGPTGPTGMTGAQGPPGVQGVAGVQGAMGPAGAMGLTGPAGPAGLNGIAGPAGPAGPMGSTGSTGAVGPQGPAGPPGPPGSGAGGGLVYAGAFSFVTTYGVGDVVVWQGSSYTSLAASNLDNEPDISPLSWGLLSAAGAQGSGGAAGPAGPQGPAGPAGVTGAEGPAGPPGLEGAVGPAGAAGSTGPQGPQGLPGPVGITWQGVYSPSSNYALADGVIYNGSGYVSLEAANHGNTPDQSPAAWSLFAAAGSAGAIGPPGATGPAGLTGATGASGPAGPAGLQGPQGMQGPPAVNYTGNYSSTTNYAFADAASYGGSTYVSLVNGNDGNTPDQSPADWAVLVAEGPAGPTGATGAAGAAGSPGAAGLTGPAGPAGLPLTFLGEWAVALAYSVGDAVGYGGASYIALAGNTGREPDVSPSYWGVLAQAGAVGPTGAAGAAGAQGPTGYPGPTGAAGPPGAAGPIGPAGLNYRGGYSANATYALADAVSYQGASWISLTGGNTGNAPAELSSEWGLLAAAGSDGAVGATGPAGPMGTAGVAGSAGPPGAAGAVGVNFRGAWGSGVNYAANDAVTFAGSTYLATAASVAVEPDQNASLWTVLAAAGATGPSGATGVAATVQVGTVTTGAAGSSATVVNAGTNTAAVLNFTIPQGAAGSSGAGGGGSATGLGMVSMVHAVSYAATYYAVNNPNQDATETAQVLTWVPNGCTATQLTVFSEQAATITVTLRVGPIGGLVDSALSCQVSTGASCTSNGSVIVPTGEFMDLSIVHPDSTVSGVWTGVSCS